MSSLRHVIAMVTGGTGLLGRAIVHEFAARGARLVVPYRDEMRFRLLKAGATEGGIIEGHACDLTDLAAVREFVAWARERVGRLTALVCAAGGYATGAAAEVPADVLAKQHAVNFSTAVNAAQAVLPGLRERRGGKIVTLGGPPVLGGPRGAGRAAYAASKLALRAFTEALAEETRGENIQCNMIVPGTIRADVPGQTPPPGVSPEAVARAIAFLCSSDSDAVSGAVINAFGTQAL